MILFLLAVLFLAVAVGALVGAPYLPARYPDIEAALDLAELKAGETLIDLGSGDGRVLLAAAKRGATAIGYEVSPVLFVWSWLRCLRHGPKIKIYLRDYWLVKLPQADVVYTFLARQYVKRLNKKLTAEIKTPTKLVSYVFELPREIISKNRNCFLYRYP